MYIASYDTYQIEEIAESNDLKAIDFMIWVLEDEKNCYTPAELKIADKMLSDKFKQLTQ